MEIYSTSYWYFKMVILIVTRCGKWKTSDFHLNIPPFSYGKTWRSISHGLYWVSNFLVCQFFDLKAAVNLDTTIKLNNPVNKIESLPLVYSISSIHIYTYKSSSSPLFSPSSRFSPPGSYCVLITLRLKSYYILAKYIHI